MATVHREAGISFRVYPHDHGPPHVHACIGRGYAKLSLPSEDEPVRVLRIVGRLTTTEIVKAVSIVQANAELMRLGWKRFHG